MRPDLQSGDIVFFSSQHVPGLGGWLSRAIAWFTSRANAEPPTQATHVGMMRDPLRVCEALRHVTIQPLAARLEGNWIEIYRPFILLHDSARSSALRGCLTSKCDKWEGRKYGWWKNIAQALDGLIGERYVFRRLCRLKQYPICSWLVAYAFETCVARVAKLLEIPDAAWPHEHFFGVPPNAATPDDIHDACQDPVRFIKIWSQDPTPTGSSE